MNPNEKQPAASTPVEAPQQGRCTICGAPRIKLSPLTDDPTHEWGACSFIECSDPLHDYRSEQPSVPRSQPDHASPEIPETIPCTDVDCAPYSHNHPNPSHPAWAEGYQKFGEASRSAAKLEIQKELAVETNFYGRAFLHLAYYSILMSKYHELKRPDSSTPSPQQNTFPQNADDNQRASTPVEALRNYVDSKHLDEPSAPVEAPQRISEGGNLSSMAYFAAAHDEAEQPSAPRSHPETCQCRGTGRVMKAGKEYWCGEAPRSQPDAVAIRHYDVRPFSAMTGEHVNHVERWLRANEKSPADVKWSLYPIGMVQRWIERAEAAESGEAPRVQPGWRVGIKVPINVYQGDRPICQCHTALDAQYIVRTMNAAESGEAPRSQPDEAKAPLWSEAIAEIVGDNTLPPSAKWLLLYAELRESICSCNKTDTPEKGPEYDYTCEWCEEHPEGNWDAVEAALEALVSPARKSGEAPRSGAGVTRELILELVMALKAAFGSRPARNADELIARAESHAAALAEQPRSAAGVSLPGFDECEIAARAKQSTTLQQFIFDYTPAGGLSENMFRNSLVKLLGEYHAAALAETPQPDADAIDLLVAVRDSAVTDAGTCSICLLDPHSPGCVIDLVEKFVRKLDDADSSTPSEEKKDV